MPPIYSLNVHKRTSSDPSNKKLREKGEVPAVYYRKDRPSIPIKISQNDLEAMLHSHYTLIKLNVDDEENLLVVAKEIQREPVSHRAIHLSFEGVKEGEAFHISLPVKLEHDEDCGWAKAKGMAQLKANHLNIEVLPKKMPEYIAVDINNLEIGDTLHVSDLKMPEIKFLDNPHLEVVSIIFHKIVEEPEKPKEAVAVEAASGKSAGEEKSSAKDDKHAKDHKEHKDHKGKEK